MRNTLRALDFFFSLHLTIFERPEDFEFFNSQLGLILRFHRYIGEKKLEFKNGFGLGPEKCEIRLELAV